jgi:uncharacterized protein YcbX
MKTNEKVGSVAGIWLFPVKSMQGQRLGSGEFTERGLVGDRAYAIIDSETGKVASAKSVRLFPELFKCKAAFVEPPRLNSELPPVQITLPDGATVNSDSGDADNVLSEFFGREVILASAAPDDFTIDQYHPNVDDADPAGHRDEIVEQKLGSAFFDEAGVPSPVPVGAFFDLFPLTVLTTSTLDKLSGIKPDSNFDERRFRMNIIVDTNDDGFVENNWIGRGLALGEAMRIEVAMPDPRCVMTTLEQDDLPRDTDILRTLVRHNRLPVAESGLFPCAGVYAVVQASGRLQIGDSVSLLEQSL